MRHYGRVADPNPLKHVSNCHKTAYRAKNLSTVNVKVDSTADSHMEEL